MRIGVDARELCGHTTGVGRYLAGLLEEWSHPSSVAHEFVLYTPEPLSLSLDARRFTTRLVAGSGGTLWEQVRLPKAMAADRLDVLFSPAYTTPLRLDIPTVLAIHDISFVAHPEWFGMREGARRRWLTTQAAARASAIVTISEFSKRELVERLGVAAAKIAVIPPGVTPPPAVPAAARTCSVLYVGSIFNRRHVPDLVRAFAPIARRDPSVTLDVVGDNRTHPHQDLLGLIAREGLQGRAHWRSYVPDEDLYALYRRARTFAFLSEYEGLGLTPLEAIGAGVPVVLLDTPVAHESCGSAALYVGLGDIAATTRALEALLFDEAVRARLLDAAPRVLARYSWVEAARETLAVIVRSA
jgi:glycosyltransferase involved in cell wall biosynthesis